MSIHDPTLLSAARNMNITDPVSAYIVKILEERDADEKKKKEKQKAPKTFTFWQTIIISAGTAPLWCVANYFLVAWVAHMMGLH